MNIDNKIRADLFRNRIEDKNQLTGAGAIYVGTGKKTEIEGAGVSGTTGTYYETTGIAPSGNREIPISVANESGDVTGLKFKNIETILGEQELKITGQTGFQINTSTGPIGFSGEKISITGSQSISALGKTIMLTGQSFLINGTDGTEISNISTRSNFKDSTSYTLYTAPSGTPSLSNNGETGTYKNDTSERNLAPIIYNIGQRLDSLGFKEEVVEDSSGNNLLTFRKIGYYVLVTLEQSISVVWEADDFYCNVPQAFQKQKKETKTLFSIYLKASDRDLDTVVSISYRIDDSEHTIEFKNQDAIYNPCIDARFNKGIIFGYDIRE